MSGDVGGAGAGWRSGPSVRRPRPRSGAAWTVAGAAAAAAVPSVLLAVLLVLAVYAWPSIVWSGSSFFTSTQWDLGNLYGTAVVVRHGYQAQSGASFGSLAYIAGTALSSALALLLAVPVGLGAAVVLAERARGGTARILGFFIELIAGVPSVVFGLWGLVVVVPWIERSAGPALSAALGFIPWLNGPVASGAGLLAAVVVLAVMVLPLVAALSRDALVRVPQGLREQGRALGLTEWEILRDLVLPAAWPGIAGSVVLALGRALGETMAVLMVSGGGAGLPASIYSPISTMASSIVADLDSALTDPTGMAVHALAELAVVLLLISVFVNLVAPLVGRGVSRVRAVLSPRGEES